MKTMEPTTKQFVRLVLMLLIIVLPWPLPVWRYLAFCACVSLYLALSTK